MPVVAQLKKVRPSTIASDEACEKYATVKYIFHVGTGIESAFHVDLWLPYFNMVDAPMLIVFRSLALYDSYVSNNGSGNAVYLKTGADVDAFQERCPQLKAIFYAANTGNVVNFTRFNDLEHIFIGHGDSEKGASCHKFFRVYDEVWTAGQAHIDRFKRAKFNSSSIVFRKVGRPGLSDILTNSQNRKKTGNILYLPTWEGAISAQEYTSVFSANQLVTAAHEVTSRNIVAKFHPFTGNRLSSLKEVDRELSGDKALAPCLTVKPRGESAWALMQDAECLVADISSVVTDFLATQKPIFLYIPKGKDIEVSQSDIQFEDYAYTFSSIKELSFLLNRVVVQGMDFLRDQRARALNYFVDVDLTIHSGFAKAVQQTVGGGVQVKSPATGSLAPNSSSTRQVEKGVKTAKSAGRVDAKPPSQVSPDCASLPIEGQTVATPLIDADVATEGHSMRPAVDVQLLSSASGERARLFPGFIAESAEPSGVVVLAGANTLLLQGADSSSGKSPKPKRPTPVEHAASEIELLPVPDVEVQRAALFTGYTDKPLLSELIIAKARKQHPRQKGG